MANIFRQAYQIVTTKSGAEMTGDELKLVSSALGIMINELPKFEPIYDELPIELGLLRLANLLEGN